MNDTINCFSIIRDDLCSGCGNCVRVCPVKCFSTGKSSAGFTKAVIELPESCVRCRRCVEMCPEMRQIQIPEKLPECFAAWHKDREIVRKSSSGGLFTAFAQYIIEKGGYVGGVVMRDNQASYILTDSMAGVSEMRGSKYIPADVSVIVQEVRDKLHSGAVVLLVLLPCAASAMRKILSADKFTGKLYIIDLVCAGVPSPYYFQKETADQKINVSTFRNKQTSWLKSQGLWGSDAETGNAKYIPVNKSPFYNAFACGQILRKSCYDCRHANLDRASDLTMGDFWGENRFPEQENDGISMIMVNSPEGYALLECIRQEIILHKAVLSDAARRNPRLIFGVEPRKEYFLTKKFNSLIGKLPWGLMKFLYSGGYKHLIFGKLFYHLFWNKKAAHRKKIIRAQQEALDQLIKLEKDGRHAEQ